ncbi:hypothetical protein [Streptomyces sp. NPDC005438]|uniref:hypothetical protein n=1 Tax=Streptomyces sp. NPDC005438 TaxID=3156880 RepID=UPI0033B4E41B
MFWEALGSLLLGLALSTLSLWRLPGRFPQPSLTLATGTLGTLLGGLITRVVLGPGHHLATFAVALGVGLALLSLTLSDSVGRSFRGGMTPPPAR